MCMAYSDPAQLSSAAKPSGRSPRSTVCSAAQGTTVSRNANDTTQHTAPSA
jgi:hypothetical protein